MPEKTTLTSKEQTESKWTALNEAQKLIDDIGSTSSSLIKVPDKIDLRLKSGFFFGLAVGFGFCIGFIISLLILLGSVSFYIYAKFPQLFH